MCGFLCLPDAHILSVLSTTACLLMTRTPGGGGGVVPPFAWPGVGGVCGGRMSAAFVTATEAGKIMGRMSWMSGNKDAILFRYAWAGARRIRVESTCVLAESC